MAHSHILDTNIVSDLIRNPNGAVRDKISELGESAICISIIVASEIRYGCAKKNSKPLTKRANIILNALSILPIETPCDEHYAKVRADLEANGTPIGPNDLLIAAHALRLGLTLVTHNEQEFKRVKGLRTENWLK